MTKQTILDRVLEHDMLSVNIGNRIEKILAIGDEVGEWDLCAYLMDAACNITWTVGHESLRVRLERVDYDFGVEEEYVLIPFAWLDMDDEELKKVMQERVELEELREHKRAVDQLRRDADYLGYTLTEIRE